MEDESLNKFEHFAQMLLAWFEQNQRQFPWRKTKDPYNILLAEIFLRKTHAPEVVGVYERFVFRYPRLETLANATQQELESALKPLGLYRRRAKDLRRLATLVIAKYNGEVPSAREELIELPGVGNYIANAVLCFAFGETVPLLDTNIIRVVTRVFSFKPKRKRARDDPEMWRAVRQIVPKGKARDYNLAMLDLAATVCLPRKPKCVICPVLCLCNYYCAANDKKPEE